MLYDGHITCGADILSEDTSDESDKYKDYEEIANNEDSQINVGEDSSENADVMTTPDREELPLISTEKRRAIGKAAIFGAYINYMSAANEKGELFPYSQKAGLLDNKQNSAIFWNRHLEIFCSN